MKAIKLIASLLCASMLLSIGISAAPGQIQGATNITTNEITLKDGTKTGVTYTEMILPTKTTFNPSSSKSKKACFTEFKLSDTNLSVEVINCGGSMTQTATVLSAVNSFTSANKTVLSAINGDLWMTPVHSGAEMSKKVLKVSRGIMIADGEIWASQQIGMENACATNDERGNTTPPKAAFGVTDTNQPVVGSPNIGITITVNGKKINGGGINRLPAPDSLIVYNHRCFTTNYALNDSYEIAIESNNTAFTVDGIVTGTVKGIYESGSTDRPSITSKTIVITARGNKISLVKDKFKVGDTVSFDCSIVDTMGNTSLWENVKEAIGGHIQILKDSKTYTALSGNTEYPATFIGYKDDGTVMFTTLTSNQNGEYVGANYNSVTKFLKDAGYNSVFMLDGGGSATMVTLQNGTYSVRSKSSDGSPRPVINAIAVVWNKTPVCEKQGSLSHIKYPMDLSDIPGYHIPSDLLDKVISSPSNCDLKYNKSADAFELLISTTSNDPYAYLDYTSLGNVSANDYKYIVFKAKTNHTSPSTTLKLYYSTSSASGPDESYTKNVSIPKSDAWSYCIADMSSDPSWKGTITSMRLDIFDSIVTYAGKGTVFSLAGITLCKTAEEAEKVASGNYLPKGAVLSYSDFLQDPSSATHPGGTLQEEEDIPSEDESITETSGAPATDEQASLTTESTVPSDTVQSTVELSTKDLQSQPVEDTAETSADISSDEETEKPSETAEANASDTSDVTHSGNDSSSGMTLVIVIICVAAAAIVAGVIVFARKKQKT